MAKEEKVLHSSSQICCVLASFERIFKTSSILSARETSAQVRVLLFWLLVYTWKSEEISHQNSEVKAHRYFL